MIHKSLIALALIALLSAQAPAHAADTKANVGYATWARTAAARCKQWRFYFMDMALTGTGQQMLGGLYTTGSPEYQELLKKYPNPPAPNPTNFTRSSHRRLAHQAVELPGESETRTRV